MYIDTARRTNHDLSKRLNDYVEGRYDHLEYCELNVDDTAFAFGYI